MAKHIRIMLVIVLASIGVVQAQESQVLADFEVDELFLGKDSDGLDIGFVTWGDSAGNVTLELVAAEGDLALPEQGGDNAVLQVTYDIGAFGGFTHALTDGEEWVPQDWTDYNTLDFWLYGAESGGVIQVEIFDNRAPDSTSDTAERWYYRLEDDFTGWQFFSIPFDVFQRRTDWQPSGAPADEFGLTEVHGYAFTFPAGVGEHVTYIDQVALSTGEGNAESRVPPADEASGEETTTELIDMPEYDPDGEWVLVWSDEFDVEAGEPINADYWTCEVGGHGWGNAQLEHNTDRTENVVHDGDGHLLIIAREEEYRGNDYTSGRCNTMDKVGFTYGRVEARLNLPEGQGIWPAFWMLGADFPEIGWPDSGEIDIMEYVGKEPRSIHGTVHGPGYSGSGGLGTRYIFDEPVADEFHVFGIEWEPEVIRWTIDGEVFHTMTPELLYGMGDWVYDHDFFMLINVAVGGHWPGNPDDTTVFPQEMLVDWVRVYQRIIPQP
jgi:beta-glucanase (GH16 family)